MPTKRKLSLPSHKAKTQTARSPAETHGKLRPYEPSSDQTPPERLARLLEDAEAGGIKPLDEAAMQAMHNVWPHAEDLDEFIVWLRASRREER